MREITLEDLKVLALAVLKNKLLIVLCMGAGFCAGMFYFARQPVSFSHSATATVSVVFDTGANQGQITGIAALANYAEIVTTDRVAAYAAELLEGEGLTALQIQRMITTASRVNSHILSITARSESPRLAILVANAVAESFVTQVSVITGNHSIQMLDAARAARIATWGRERDIVFLATAGALFAACALVVLLELAGGKVRSVKQCVDDMGELLAVIPKAGRRK